MSHDEHFCSFYPIEKLQLDYKKFFDPITTTPSIAMTTDPSVTIEGDPHFLVHVGGTPVCFDFHGGNDDVVQLLHDDVTG